MFLISFHLRPINLIRVCLVFLGLLWLGALAVRATPYYVETNGSDDPARTGLDWANAFLTISNGVAKATSGDTVWVSNGTYTLSSKISVGSKNSFTIRSLNGRDQTFINGNYSNTTNACFFFYNTTSVLSGFTISNGCVNSGGGGVYMQADCQVTLTNCVIAGNRATNTADCQGGGIFCNGINNLIVDCVVTGNSSGQFGGGIMLYSGTVRNCTIIGNSSSGHGSGAYEQSASVISNCEIIRNTVTSSGAGVYIQSASVMDSCVIVSNQSSTAAVALDPIDSSTPNVLKNSVIKYNNGIGVKVYSGSSVRNCLITRNSGVGIYMQSLTLNIGNAVNCTIVSNNDYGITINGNIDRVFNCIVASNKFTVDGTLTTTNPFCYCSIPGYTFPLAGWSEGNITTDPVFIDGIPGHENNWRLANNSPCINAGTNMSWMTNSFDLDGRARIRYGRVDMGAYELINEATLYNFQ